MIPDLIIVGILFAVPCFSFGVSFERDRQRWNKQAKRRSLGASVLNTQKL